MNSSATNFQFRTKKSLGDYCSRVLHPCLARSGLTNRLRGPRRVNFCKGSVVLIVLIGVLILSRLSMGFVLNAVTDTIISHGDRRTLSTAYIAEAGSEEAIKMIMQTPRSQFNPTLFNGTFPVDVTRCFYNDSSAPPCPVPPSGTPVLRSVPVAVGSGAYRAQITYLGRTLDAAGQTLHKYLLTSTASLNSNVQSKQVITSAFYTEDLVNSFPPHPITSCGEPTGSSSFPPQGWISPTVVDPSAPSIWPGTSDANYGVTPMCGLPDAAEIEQAIQENADYSYNSSITDSAPLPPQFWKVPPSGSPPDPMTGVPYLVYINGDLTVNGNSTIYGVYFVTGSVTFTGSASFQGVLYAPNGTFTGNGYGSPNVPKGIGGIFANQSSCTGNHYSTLLNTDYTNAYLGQLPFRLSRGAR